MRLPEIFTVWPNLAISPSFPMSWVTRQQAGWLFWVIIFYCEICCILRCGWEVFTMLKALQFTVLCSTVFFSGINLLNGRSKLPDAITTIRCTLLFFHGGHLHTCWLAGTEVSSFNLFVRRQHKEGSHVLALWQTRCIFFMVSTSIIIIRFHVTITIRWIV